MRGAVDHLQQEEHGEGFRAMRIRIVPITMLCCRRVILAIQTAIPFRVQVEVNGAIEYWQMA